MMNFQQIEAQHVRPGALLMEDLGKARLVHAVTRVSDYHGALQFSLAEGRRPPITRAKTELVWVAQR